MTSTTEHRPPLQAVYPPQHDDRAAWQRDRQRFAAFLTAKDLVLGYTRPATQGAGRLAARLRLGGLCTMVRRSYGLVTASGAAGLVEQRELEHVACHGLLRGGQLFRPPGHQLGVPAVRRCVPSTDCGK